MLYHYNRPLNQSYRSPRVAQYYQWRSFSETTQDVYETIEETFELVETESRTDKYFLLAGRSKVVPRLVNDEYFEVLSLVDDRGPVELWEQSVKTEFPMRRSLASMISAKIPKFHGACSSVATPESLTEALSRKSKFFEAVKVIRRYEKDGVRAEISDVEIDGVKQMSLALQCDSAEPLVAMLKAFGLKSKDNTNYGDYLMIS